MNSPDLVKWPASLNTSRLFICLACTYLTSLSFSDRPKASSSDVTVGVAMVDPFLTLGGELLDLGLVQTS